MGETEPKKELTQEEIEEYYILKKESELKVDTFDDLYKHIKTKMNEVKNLLGSGVSGEEYKIIMKYYHTLQDFKNEVDNNLGWNKAYNQLKKEIEPLQVKIKWLEDENQKLKQQKTDGDVLQKENDKLKKENVKLLKTNEELQKKYDKTFNELDNLTIDYNKLIDKYESVKRELDYQLKTKSVVSNEYW